MLEEYEKNTLKFLISNISKDKLKEIIYYLTALYKKSK